MIVDLTCQFNVANACKGIFTQFQHIFVYIILYKHAISVRNTKYVPRILFENWTCESATIYFNCIQVSLNRIARFSRVGKYVPINFFTKITLTMHLVLHDFLQ